MTWNPWTTPIDQAIIGGLVTPGILRIRNADSPRDWDERNGYGWSGSYPVFLGVKLSRFDLGFEMYNDADWALWELMRPLLEKPPFGKKPKALDIYHPALSSNGLDIKSIEVTNLKVMEVDDYGVITIPVEVMAFRAPKIALAKPVASQQKPDDDPYQKMIDKLDSENQAERVAQGLVPGG